LSARYLVRFDDICPTMNWTVWRRVETILLEQGIKPIIAVVPDNRDPKLQIEDELAEFWGWVSRRTLADGWTVGLHGYQHLYCNEEAGLVGVHHGSEFAGLTRNEQDRKITAACAIFRRHGIAPDLWVAPGHSFDRTTVSALLASGITVVSDGFSFRPVTRFGSTWVPQQLWNFRTMPFGLWTVCLHVNSWSEADLAAFEANVRRFRGAIVSIEDVLGAPAPQAGFIDWLFDLVWRLMVRMRMHLRNAA